MKFTRETLTIKNKFYGEDTTPAYVLNSLAVAKWHGYWRVYHLASGIEIADRLRRRKCGDAKKVTQHLVALPVDWALDSESDEFLKEFRSAADDIRRIANTVAV